MAKGQVKKGAVKVPARVEVQADNMIFALDIGTRSVIGMVGVAEEDKVKIIAIEREDHTERAMVDGQIENIEKVSMLAKKVKRRLETKLHTRLKRVCVAAAGRALRTSRVEYEVELPGIQLINDEIINRLEAGAISKAEEMFESENEALEDTRRFYLVGYTVCQYFLDQYLISSLKEHRGKHIKVDLIATFLPSEVVESLYTTMNKTGLEVASITLEPIAAINAAIPENLRLLNLVMVDIGAGTSDIAACTGGSVTGYTMATVAGDEVTEAVMKEFLVDFRTAEAMKAQIEQDEQVTFTDILGFERTVSRDEVFRCIQGISNLLCEEISEKILAVNGAPPSALFLAGGGSKLAGLKEGLTAALQMDSNRVAIAGNNFRTNAFSDEYDLNNPEYATPLGIVISSGLNMINDSFRVTLNEKSAKLFRSGSFTVMNLLMMNGYSFQDMLGRPGRPVSVMINGKRKVFYGTAPQPAALFINRKEGKLSDIVRAGDQIEFIPAISGASARPFLGDIDGALDCDEVTLNGEAADLETPLKNGDVVWIRLSKSQVAQREREEREKAAAAEKEAAEGGEASEDSSTDQEGERQKEKTDAVKPDIMGRGEAHLEERQDLAPLEEPTGIRTSNPQAGTISQGTESPQAEPILQAEVPQGGENPQADPILPTEVPQGGENPQAGTILPTEVPQGGENLQAEPKSQAEVPQGRENLQADPISQAEVPQGRENPQAGTILPTEATQGRENRQDATVSQGASYLQDRSAAEGMADFQRKANIEAAPDRQGNKAAAGLTPDFQSGTDMGAEPDRQDGAAMEKRSQGTGQIGLNFGDGGNGWPKAPSEEEKSSYPVRMQEPRDIVLEKKAAARTETILFQLNGSQIRLPRKKDGTPYYLMDMIERSGIDLKQPKGKVVLSVNGVPGAFQQRLFAGDIIRIEEEK